MNSSKELYKKNLSRYFVSKINFKRSWDDKKMFLLDYDVNYFLRELRNKHSALIDNESSIQKNKNF